MRTSTARLARLTAAVAPADEVSCAASLSQPVGEFDSHGDNGLRVTEMFSVRNKVALVTGGSIGIGRMIAEGLAVNGCKVYITSRKLAACEATAAELNEVVGDTGGEVIPFASDLGEVEGCQAAADFVSARESKLHILINNAGATWGGNFDEYPDSAWQKVCTCRIFISLAWVTEDTGAVAGDGLKCPRGFQLNAEACRAPRCCWRAG